MNSTRLPGLIEAIKKILESGSPVKPTAEPGAQLAELFILHYNLMDSINKAEAASDEDLLRQELETARKNIEDNIRRILDSLGRLIGRKVLVHVVAQDDTVWRISRKYDSDVIELASLNSIKGIFRLDGKKVLLVPVKTS